MINVGDTFSADYCDGRYEWTVDEVIDGRVVLASSEAADKDWGSISPRAWTVREVDASIAVYRDYRAAQARHDDFWNSTRVGDVLHYHNGFGEWVRGEVVAVDGQQQLQPVALVGNWDHHWEYHWAHVKTGTGAWQPSAGNVYESSQWTRGDAHGDPRTMEPLDFTDRESGNDYFEHCMKRAALA